jgi:hypothetical protein
MLLEQVSDAIALFLDRRVSALALPRRLIAPLQQVRDQQAMRR